MSIIPSSSNTTLSVARCNMTFPLIPSQERLCHIHRYEREPLTDWQATLRSQQFVDLLQTAWGFQSLQIKPLVQVFKIITQEQNQVIKEALIKPQGYFWRLFSNESWEEWSEHRTALGEVVRVFIHYIQEEAPVKNQLSFDTIQRANVQADGLLKQSRHSLENPRTRDVSRISFASLNHFFTRIFNFNFIPGAQATSIEVSVGEDSDCALPIGSYIDSCFNSTVQYLPDEKSCLLSTTCASIFSAIPAQSNQLRFDPGKLLVLGNNNGTLEIEGAHAYLSPQETHTGIHDHFEAVAKTDRKWIDPIILSTERERVQLAEEKLRREQDEMIRRLDAGATITLNEEGKAIVVTSENEKMYQRFYSSEALSTFQRLARSTGGIMGLSSRSHYLPHMIEKIFEHIMQNISLSDSLDVAFVLDTTSSMSDNIEQVKKNLTEFLRRLKQTMGSSGNITRVAILQYRDKSDIFLNHRVIDFTSDLDKVAVALSNISVYGGGDDPEAAFDALLAAKDQLSWNQKTKHVAILISDAPPHPKTVDGLYGEKDVMQQYQAASTNIVIYPIITDIQGS